MIAGPFAIRCYIFSICQGYQLVNRRTVAYQDFIIHFFLVFFFPSMVYYNKEPVEVC